MQEEKSLNYVYFGFLFILLSFLHVYSISAIYASSTVDRTFYSIYAIGQCFLEVGALMVCSHFLIKRFPKSLNSIFIGFTFLLFIIHMVDFPLVRLMGFSIWFGLDIVSAESFENFIEMLYAAGISLQTWLYSGLSLLVLFACGLLFFKFTNRISKKYPLKFSYRAWALSLVTGVIFLSLFDFNTYGLTATADTNHYLRALPWKSTLFGSPFQTVGIGKGLKALPEEKEIEHFLQGSVLAPIRNPNIFLFVTESLREDFIDSQTAPNLSQFRQENISFDFSFSAANNTQSSWFSIFHARHPFYWGKKPYLEGALPLKILKQGGYKTHVYTSSRLSYYQMGQVLFGRKYELVDTLHDFSHDGSKESYESDAKCFAQLTQDMEDLREENGHLFIVFLDATHFPYSWPKEAQVPFTPVVEAINYLKIACSKENVEGIKNRYRNSIFHLDKHFQTFSKTLTQMRSGEDSVVVFTGDHGEEFYEQGNIFHASDLTAMQTRVPLYYKFGKKTEGAPHQGVTSHVDIFPSILDYIFGEKSLIASQFDGESIFKEMRKQFAITARYNGNRSPYEFFIHNGKHKCVLRFANKTNIFNSSLLEIVAHKDEKDELVVQEDAFVEKEFKHALEHLFVAE